MQGRIMLITLDQTSRDTLGRFGLKVLIAVVIAGVGQNGLLIATSGWLSLYATFTAVLAIVFRQRIPAPSFNHWDEAMWLSTLSMGLRLIHRTL